MLIQSNITEPSDNLDQRIGALSQQKRALLALKLKQRGREFNSFPLSFAQQRLWFLHQFDVNDLYNISQAIHLKGPLNVSALARTFSEVERRHEVLRTSFLTVDGEPVQRINDWRPVHLPVVDLSALSVTEREVTRIAAYEAQRAFDLTDRSLVRLSLLRLAEDEHVVLITMHHIVSDGWSLAVMIDEIAQLYLAFTAGRPSPLSEVPIQYADYAVWQRQWLANGVMDEQLRYWKEMLRGVPPVLELPTDRARPAVKSFRGASLSFVLSEQVSEALRQLSRREGSTLFMTLLAVFQILLYRYTGQNDIVVGSPIAGRNRVETERLIGLFVNTLALRTRINSESSFIDLLAHVKEITLGAYAHQDLPFEKLVDELQPERSLSHGPIFQVMFQVHNFTQHEDHAFSGLSLTALGGESSRAKFDLTLSVIDHQQLRLSFEYDTDLFEASTIVRMTKHFRNLVESILANPDLPVSALSLLESEEEKQLVTGWNETALAYARELTLDEMIAAQSERTPEAVAVVHEGRRVTVGSPGTELEFAL